jgi:hypothetical protein
VTAAAASDDQIVDEPGDVISRLSKARDKLVQPVKLKIAEARPVVSTDDPPRLTGELVIDGPQGDRLAGGRTVTARPREEPLLVDEVSGASIELDSFDLFATASIGISSESSRRTETDISKQISRLVGSERGHRLRPTSALIEVDDFVVIDLSSRYAPYRDGKVFGEERSMLSESVNRAHSGPVEIVADLRIAGANGSMRRRRVTNTPLETDTGQSDVRIDDQENGHRLVIGPLGDEPTWIQVTATMTDRFGLQATTHASTHNFRVAEAQGWVERAANVALARLRQRLDDLERDAHSAPTQEVLASAAMLQALVDNLEALDGPEAVPAGQVAGAVLLAFRVAELLPAAGPTGDLSFS